METIFLVPYKNMHIISNDNLYIQLTIIFVVLFTMFGVTLYVKKILKDNCKTYKKNRYLIKIGVIIMFLISTYYLQTLPLMQKYIYDLRMTIKTLKEIIKIIAGL